MLKAGTGVGRIAFFLAIGGEFGVVVIHGRINRRDVRQQHGGLVRVAALAGEQISARQIAPARPDLFVPHRMVVLGHEPVFFALRVGPAPTIIDKIRVPANFRLEAAVQISVVIVAGIDRAVYRTGEFERLLQIDEPRIGAELFVNLLTTFGTAQAGRDIERARCRSGCHQTRQIVVVPVQPRVGSADDAIGDFFGGGIARDIGAPARFRHRCKCRAPS